MISTDQAVGAHAANQGVIAIRTGKCVVTAGAGQYVIATATSQGSVATAADEGQVFNAGGREVGSEADRIQRGTDFVRTANIGNRIGKRIDDIHVVARATDQCVVAGAAIQCIVTAIATQAVVAGQAADVVVLIATIDAVAIGSANRREVAGTDIGQDFDVGCQSDAGRRSAHLVGTLTARLRDDIGFAIDIVNVVAEAAHQGIDPRAAVQRVVAAAAGD